MTNGIQSDFSYRYHADNIIRYGFNTSYENAKISNQSTVFPDGQCNGSNVCTGTPETIVSNTDKGAVNAGIYLQDEWKAADKLTINYGWHLTITTPMSVTIRSAHASAQRMI